MDHARKPTRTSVSGTLPVSTAEAETQLNLASGQQTTLLTRLIAVARDHFEDETGWAVMQSTYTQTYQCFPPCEIPLLRRPASSITGLTYVDTAGASQTWSSGNYRLDAGGAHPRLVYDSLAIFPTLATRPEAITVTYVAGAANAAAVPEQIRHALLLHISHLFENRGIVERGGLMETPRAYQSLIAPFMRSTYP